MKPLNSKELQTAYTIWLRYYGSVEADQQVEGFLNQKIDDHNSTERQWLALARRGLLLSAGKLAKKMGISRAAYAKFEKNEKLGTISVGSLEKCAEAMNCEFVYAIRPKERMPFSKVVWEKILRASAKQIEIRKTPEHMKSYALAAIARDKMQDPKYRRSQNWSQA